MRVRRPLTSQQLFRSGHRPKKPKGRIPMLVIAAVRPRFYLPLIFLSLSLINMGCGGGSYSSPAEPAPQPSPSPGAKGMQGSWTIAFLSDVSNDYTVLEANISQSGT